MRIGLNHLIINYDNTYKEESPIYNMRGEEIKNKRCIVIVTPPSYEVKMYRSISRKVDF
jgi:hypothetical protein